MSRVRITQLREERHQAFERMKEINDLQEAENRALTTEEGQEYEKAEKRLEEIDPEVRRLERAEGIEQRFGDAGAPKPEDINAVEERELPKDWAGFMEQRNGTPLHAKAEYREAFFGLLAAQGQADRIKPEQRDMLDRADREYRAMSAITGTDGGYVVPVDTYNRIVKKLDFFSQLRQVATVLATATGVDLKIPIESNIGMGGWEAENTSYLESSPVFGTTTLKAWKYTKVIKIPKELLQDSVVDIEAYIADVFGRSFGLGQQAAYVAGDGVGKPTGFVGSAQIGNTVANTAALNADALIDLMYSVSPPYRMNGSWLASDMLARIVRKFKDSQGRYLWELSLQAGQPDMLLGKPFMEDPFLAAPGAAAKPILFGDMSYIWIRDVAGLTMQRLVELFAVQGQVGFLMDHRSDVKLTQPEAVQALVVTA